MKRVLAAALLVGTLLPALATAQQIPEYDLKAAYLYNFALFVEWPPEDAPRAEISICVIGHDPFGTALDALEGKPAHQRRIAVRRVTSLRAARECHVLYVGAPEESRAAQIHAAVRGLPVLTVGEAESGAESAAIVTLTRRNARIGFAINVGAAHQSRLRISSRLLRLAQEVIGE